MTCSAAGVPGRRDDRPVGRPHGGEFNLNGARLDGKGGPPCPDRRPGPSSPQDMLCGTGSTPPGGPLAGASIGSQSTSPARTWTARGARPIRRGAQRHREHVLQPGVRTAERSTCRRPHRRPVRPSAARTWTARVGPPSTPRASLYREMFSTRGSGPRRGQPSAREDRRLFDKRGPGHDLYGWTGLHTAT